MNKHHKIFIDANIWCWYFNKKSIHHEKVEKSVNNLIKQKNVHIYGNFFVAIEIFHYLIKKLGPHLGKEKALRFLEFDFITIKQIENTQNALASILEQLVKFGAHTSIGGRDASILVSMNEENIKEIVTHDGAFRNVPNIKVIDPIE